jgi:hypothetical protein
MLYVRNMYYHSTYVKVSLINHGLENAIHVIVVLGNNKYVVVESLGLW